MPLGTALSQHTQAAKPQVPASHILRMFRRRRKRSTGIMAQAASSASVNIDEEERTKAPDNTNYERIPVPIDTSTEAARDGSDGRRDGENYHLKTSVLLPGGEYSDRSPPRSPARQPAVEPLPLELQKRLNEEKIETIDDVQRLIRKISKDSTLTSAQKTQLSQAIQSRKYLQYQERLDDRRKEQLEMQKTHASKSNVRDPQTGDFLLGCEHYPRNCKLKAKCCSSWVVCRQCHARDQIGHEMDRFQTEEVMCMLCGEVQPVSRTCVRCDTDFARYFCAICKFYDNTPDKSIYHCPECGICRLGEGLGKDNFHCRRCDACVSRDYAQNHKCLKKSLDANCPICGLYLHSSTKPVVFMRCGHTMHSHCFDEYTAEHYTCPLCHKALTNMEPYYRMIDAQLDQQQMPEEHRDKVSEVLCHDCDLRSITKFHFLYLRCGNQSCRSYNTRLIRTFRRGEEPDSATLPGADSTVMEVASAHRSSVTPDNASQGTTTTSLRSDERRMIRDIVMTELGESADLQQEPVECHSPMNDT